MTTTTVRPPIWLRAAVLVGGCALLLGVVGASWLVIRDVEPTAVAGPGLGPRVRLEGAEGAGPLRVEVRWSAAQAEVTQPALQVDGERKVWLLPTDSDVERVTLLVRQDGPGRDRLLTRRTLDVRPGEEMVVDLSDPADEDALGAR